MDDKRRTKFREFFHNERPRDFLTALFHSDEKTACYVVTRFFRHYDIYSEYDHIKIIDAAIDYTAPLFWSRMQENRFSFPDLET